MENGKIKCPNCGYEFEISDVLAGQIREQLKTELSKEVLERETALQKRLDVFKSEKDALELQRSQLEDEVKKQLTEKLADAEAKFAKKLENKYSAHVKELEISLAEQNESLKAFKQKEMDLRKKQRELEQAKEDMELEIQRKLDEEIEKQLSQKLAEAESKAVKKTEGRYNEQLKELENSLAEQSEALKTFKQQEVEFRKKQRELEQAKENAELEIQRKLDEQREIIRKDAESKASEQHRLKELEQAKIINDLRSNLEDMKRKAEQGSMETQGEVLELDFEEQLKSFFPHDEISPVPKGIRGADLIQTVKTPFGQECGILLWEMKNTKAWSGQWIPKLKDDMIETRSAIAILVSVSLPENIARFGQVDGVWVSDPLSAIPLAAALRQQLLVLERERQVSVGKNEKMEMLYQYLAGTEFKQKIEGIVEAFTGMQEQVNRDRRAMEKQWKEREKQIERIIKNTVGLYGDMQGIIGGQIPEIPALELNTEKQLLEHDDLDAEC
ncbi:MAG: DUF2130 domain-containing protein [Kiritimatiellales bacterium]